MIGRWNYAGLGKVIYGHPETYERPCAWLDEIGGTIEDWGCGCARARDYITKSKYIGIDGSGNEYADKVGIDLRTYQTFCDCLLLRDVIDHNEDWDVVLHNAIRSFTKRMVLVIFHDLGPVTKVLFRHTSEKFPDVADMQFSLADLYPFLKPYLVKIECVAADANSPNNETLFYLEKK